MSRKLSYSKARTDEEKLLVLLEMEPHQFAAHLARRKKQQFESDMVVVVRAARGYIAELTAKMAMLAQHVYTEDGVFAFPDGDIMPTRSNGEHPDVLPWVKKLNALEQRIEKAVEYLNETNDSKPWRTAELLAILNGQG